MKLFARSGVAREARTLDLAATLLGDRRRSSVSAGQSVTNDSSMRLMAVWRCRHLLADIVAGLQVEEFRPEGNRRRLVPDPSEFVRRPSSLVDDLGWRYQMVFSAVSCGNAVAYITDVTPAGWPRRAEVVPIDQWSVEQKGGFLSPPVWRIGNKVVDTDRVIHMPAFGPRPGSVLGMNPIEYARQSIGLGLAVRDFGASWYASGGHPTTLLTTETSGLSDDQLRTAKESFRSATLDDHIAVMGDGWDLKSVQVAPDDALFLNATNASVADICGYHGIPAELLGYAAQGGGSLTYANREQRALDLLVFTVQWWLNRLERVISANIPGGRFVKINVDDLLRSDAATRWGIHDKAVRLGARNIDEVRTIEDQEPLPDGLGTQYLWPPQGATTQGAANAPTA